MIMNDFKNVPDPDADDEPTLGVKVLEGAVFIAVVALIAVTLILWK